MDRRVSFADHVRRAARALGFDAVGIARASDPLDRDFARYRAFIDAGMHGSMNWLAKYAEVRERLDGPGILLGARSVVCVARRYHRSGADTQPDASARAPVGLIARYARGRDYHGFLRRRLRRLAAVVRSLETDGTPTRARVLCDEEPVLERAWAVRAGLGFIGKNGMLIVPGLGSMVLLGEVVTSLDLAPDAPAAEPDAASSRCGACTRCLDACPTQAFVAPFVLDARRCVSYLTIEHRAGAPSGLRVGVGSHLFGCDDCQTVCPFNAGAVARSPLDDHDGEPFAPLARWSTIDLESFLAIDEAGWRTLAEGTPLKRAGRAGLARNAAIVLGNRGDAGALPALRAAAARHDDAVVREAAAWAAERVASQTTPAAFDVTPRAPSR